MKKFIVNGREVRQNVVIGALESLFECIEAVKNNGSKIYSPEMISKIKSEWGGYRRFLLLPAENALRGIESEFDLRFRSGPVEVKFDKQVIIIHVKSGIAQRVEIL